MAALPAENFAALLARLRAGDPSAAEELVKKYEAVIRVTVRARLTDSRLRRVMDTMDISQSVFAGFFKRATVGEFDLGEPNDLVRLLVSMTQNKIASQYRFHHRDKRDVSQMKDLGDDGMEQLGGALPPDQIAEGRELLAVVRDRMTADERAVADGRGMGKSWREVADELGGTPEARRKQLARAIDRVAPHLGLDPEGDDAA